MKIHLRHQGKSTTLEGPAGDERAVLDYLKYHGYLKAEDLVMVDRHPDGVVVRPPAVFG